MEKVVTGLKSNTSPFWEAVKAQYPNHWVLIGDPVYKPNGCVIQGGNVLIASEKKDDILAEGRKHPELCTIDFTGQRPKRLLLYRL